MSLLHVPSKGGNGAFMPVYHGIDYEGQPGHAGDSYHISVFGVVLGYSRLGIWAVYKCAAMVAQYGVLAANPWQHALSPTLKTGEKVELYNPLYYKQIGFCGEPVYYQSRTAGQCTHKYVLSFHSCSHAQQFFRCRISHHQAFT